MIGSVISNYKVIGELGEGGMGSVYLAEHIHLSSRKVAIKVLHRQLLSNNEIRQRFRNEAATLSHIDHINIVKIFDYIESDEGFFLIMEYVEGMTLDQYIKNVSGPLNEERAIHVLSNMLAGFGFAHQRGIIHRDVKPSNIIVSADLSVVKILDFGVAKLQSESVNMTKHGAQIGTVYYMSPEQVKGLPVDQRSDIYSMGVSLFQMVTGVNPYAGYSTEFDIFNSIINDSLPDARSIYPGVSQKIIDIISRATEKSPQQRYSSCEEFIADLRKNESDQPSYSTHHPEDFQVIDKQPATEYPQTGRTPIFYILLGMLGIVFMVVLLNFNKISDYFKWRNSDYKYCYISSLRMRSDTNTYDDYNIMPVNIEFGEMVRVLPPDKFAPWVEAKVNDYKGYINGNYLMDKEDYVILTSLLNSREKTKEIAASKHRKTLVDYVKQNYLVNGSTSPNSNLPSLEQIYYSKHIKTGYNKYYKTDFAAFMLLSETVQEIILFVYEDDNLIAQKSFQNPDTITSDDMNEFLNTYGLKY